MIAVQADGHLATDDVSLHNGKGKLNGNRVLRTRAIIAGCLEGESSA
jgi:hypothetical protein